MIMFAGNAKSNGSAYGSAASMAVFLVPLVFVRLYAPMQYLPGVIIMNVRLSSHLECLTKERLN